MRHLSLDASGERDDAAVVFPQDFHVDTRFAVEPFGVSERHQLEEVLIAGCVLGEQRQMIGPALAFPACFSITGCDIHFASDDGIDTGSCRFRVKFPCAEHVTVVGQCDSGRAVLHRPLHHIRDAARAV